MYNSIKCSDSSVHMLVTLHRYTPDLHSSRVSEKRCETRKCIHRKHTLKLTNKAFRKSKAVPLHAMKAFEERGGKAPTHS
jgi:hypothetical protein